MIRACIFILQIPLTISALLLMIFDNNFLFDEKSIQSVKHLSAPEDFFQKEKDR